MGRRLDRRRIGRCSHGAAGGLILTAAPGSAASSLSSLCWRASAGLRRRRWRGRRRAGLSAAEPIVRSRRVIALICGGALGGRHGFAAQWLADGAWPRSWGSTSTPVVPGRSRLVAPWAGLQPGHVAGRRWAGRAARPPSIRRGWRDRRCVRTSSARADACGVAPRWRDYSRHRSGIGGIAGDLDAARSAHRRTGLRSHDRRRDWNGEGHCSVLASPSANPPTIDLWGWAHSSQLL
jgi:hypothetical protein